MKKKLNRSIEHITLKRVAFFTFIFSLSLIIIFEYPGKPKHNIKKEIFKTLEKIKKKKKSQVIQYWKNKHQRAMNINNDKKMMQFYQNLLQYYKSKTNNKAKFNIKELEWEINNHYVKIYGDFYDILFIDREGYIFHSIKKESDYHANLFSKELSTTRLSKHLTANPDHEFVDYEYYLPSDEPAAFFVVAVKQNDKFLGWFILQCAINKINAMLTDYKNLGRSGEVYLVNKEKLMLSESRFIEDNTILKLKIDTVAVKEALEKKSGNRIIKDYRGITVFSSFEQFDFFGNTWIIIVEMDEDEVITNHYKKYRNYYLKRICKYLSATPRKIRTQPVKKQKIKKVDINEFSKAGHGEILITKGVGPCTAIIISYPGKFAYLAHISPTDNIYIKNPITKLFLKDKYTDFLYDLLKRIKHYDIYPYQLRNLDFTIIATHNKSFKSIIKKLLSHDVDIAQIKFIFNPQADRVDILFNPAGEDLITEWFIKGANPVNFLEETSVIKDMGSIVKKIIKYEDEII